MALPRSSEAGSAGGRSGYAAGRAPPRPPPGSVCAAAVPSKSVSVAVAILIFRCAVEIMLSGRNSLSQRSAEQARLPFLDGLFPLLLRDGRREAAHERHHFPMAVVNLNKGRAFGATTSDRVCAIGVRVERRMTRTLAPPSHHPDFQHELSILLRRG